MAISTPPTGRTPAPATAAAAPPSATPAPQEGRERDPHQVQRRWLLDHLDRPAKVRLTDGKVLSGKLLAFDQFSLLVQVAGERVLIFKHAIGYLMGAEEAEPPGT